MARRLSPGVVPMGTVRDAGRREASFVPFTPDDEAHRSALTEVLAEHDEAILRAFVRDEAALSPARLREQLGEQTRRRLGAPGVLRVGRAGVGIDELLAGVDELLSGAPRRPAGAGLRAACSRSNGRRRASASRTSDCSTARFDRASACASGEGRRRSRRRSRSSRRPARPRGTSLVAGEMATVRGLGAVRVGDAIGEPPPGEAETARFPRPALEAVVFPLRAEQAGSLRAALAQLAEQDPLIDVRQDDHRHEISVSLYGEVQKEVIQATLERDYGIAADFRETTTVCVERPARVGEAEEVIRAKTKTNITGRSSPLSTNPFTATLALRIEPAPVGSGIAFRTEVDIRSSRSTSSTRSRHSRPRWRRTSARRSPKGWRAGR